MSDFNDYMIRDWTADGYLRPAPVAKPIKRIARPHRERSRGNLQEKVTTTVLAFAVTAGLVAPCPCEVEIPNVRRAVGVAVTGLVDLHGGPPPFAHQADLASPPLEGLDAELSKWFRYTANRFAEDLEILGNS